ncbi:tRNA threonylcarbamoyladenosine dehydratase [Anaerorhabdus furcosa]|uniref:tRNA A37 threonylcarbamoyladenosine dehydratase n=1 Tax=Anaerorhabdus furcosa TaxID=118967 RepID=A0A1T4MQP7_9FIRM|nr:tRNA threonylcarbamoyladenosine dehydratase [Anaerorhabdus furcosa]SJZ69105.1 tRNA A37 threonylcarbamoyladenosine dehydratase [Anaerorhabdus furcosa]
MSNPLERVELLVGKEKVDSLRKATVLIVGVGGVGSYAAESLSRSGVGKLILVDHDVVASSNLNRQILATYETIGKPKTECMKERIHSFNLDCEVVCINEFFSVELESIFAQKIDYVIDAIDTVTAKLDLIEMCHRFKVPCISSLGMANRFNPSKVIQTTLDKTTYDPLAKALRDLAKKRNIKYKIHVTFSEEIPLKQNVEINPDGKTRKERIPPASIVFVPAASGLLCASIVTRYLLGLGK